MKHYLLAERYALGLLKALPEEELDRAAACLRNFRDAYREHADLRHVLANPVVPIDRREAVLDGVLDLLDTAAPVRRLLHNILVRGRINAVDDVARVFSMLADRTLNRVNVAVTTAKPLRPEQEARIAGAIGRFSGKEVRCDFDVEPRILGGVIARYGDMLIDGSVRARLNRLRDALIPEERVTE